MTEMRGRVIIPAGCKPWEHELRTAEALAAVGHVVEFVPKREGDYVRTADCLIDGELWEMKAPESSKVYKIEENVRRALRQSHRVVVDSRRSKRLKDDVFRRELRRCVTELKSLEGLIFVGRGGTVERIK